MDRDKGFLQRFSRKQWGAFGVFLFLCLGAGVYGILDFFDIGRSYFILESDQDPHKIKPDVTEDYQFVPHGDKTIYKTMGQNVTTPEEVKLLSTEPEVPKASVPIFPQDFMASLSEGSLEDTPDENDPLKTHEDSVQAWSADDLSQEKQDPYGQGACLDTMESFPILVESPQKTWQFGDPGSQKPRYGLIIAWAREETQARDIWNGLQALIDELALLNPSITRVDLGRSHGHRYQLSIGPFSHEDGLTMRRLIKEKSKDTVCTLVEQP